MFFMICDFCNKYKQLKNLGAKMVPKMDEKSSLGNLFVILGGLLRCLIFDEISISKKWTKNQKMGPNVFQKAKFSEARRNARGQRGTVGGSRT